MDDMPDDETLTAREAADELGLSLLTVYQAVDHGDLPAHWSTGGSTAVSITRADLDRYRKERGDT